MLHSNIGDIVNSCSDILMFYIHSLSIKMQYYNVLVLSSVHGAIYYVNRYTPYYELIWHL